MGYREKIHIHHVLLSLQPGGLENGVVNVVNRLDPEKFRSSVCCLRTTGEFAKRIIRSDASVHEMRSSGGNDWKLPFKLARLFARTKTDIVHTRNAESFYYGFLGAKLARVPTLIHSEHGRTFNDRELRYRLQRLFSLGTDAIFSVSAQLRQDLIAKVGIDPSRIDILYNGVDLSKFGAIDSQAIRRSISAMPEDFVIGSVGRLVAVKNYDLLIRALARIGHPKAMVVLVGDGPERNRLEATAAAYGVSDRVRFLGHRNDVHELLAAMDVFVLPSISEGMSNTLLEAMASRLPVVASNVGGNPEIIRDGLDGFLFESNDEGALTAKLRELINSETQRMRLARCARIRIEDKFSIDVMIARYEKLYQSCANAARCGIHI